MSDAAMKIWIEVTTGCVAIIAAAVLLLAFLVLRDWFWKVFDWRMQNSKRIQNRRIDHSVGRDCYRDNYRNWTK